MKSDCIFNHPIPQPPQPRYSSRPWPTYRFIIGENPHPTADRDGHSFEHEGTVQELNPEHWEKCDDYLYAVDLYNYAYWWEAHEVLEGLWGNFPGGSPESDLLQGIIKISAGFYKWHLQNARGVDYHYAGGTLLLKQALAHSPVYMGIDLEEYLERLAKHFAPVLTAPDPWPDPLDNYPFIVLKKTGVKIDSNTQRQNQRSL